MHLVRPVHTHRRIGSSSCVCVLMCVCVCVRACVCLCVVGVCVCVCVCVYVCATETNVKSNSPIDIKRLGTIGKNAQRSLQKLDVLFHQKSSLLFLLPLLHYCYTTERERRVRG